MKVVDQTRALELFWSDLIFLSARLSADSKAKHLATRVTDHLATYEDVVSVEQTVRKEGIIHQAKVKTAEVKVAESYRELYVAALYEFKNDKRDRRYGNLIHVNASSFARLNFATQQTECHRMKSALKLTIYGDVFRDSQNTIIDRILLEIEAAMEAQALVDEQRAQSRVEIYDWKEATNRVRMVVFGELITLSADTDSAWARSFFLAPKARKISAEERAAKAAARTKKTADKAAEKAGYLSDKADAAAKKSDLEVKKSALDVAKVTLDTRAKAEAQVLATRKAAEKAEKDANSVGVSVPGTPQEETASM